MQNDLQDALIAWQDGDLPRERTEELLTRLREDAVFRSAFAEEIWMLSQARVAQAANPRWLDLCEELEIAPKSESDGQERLERGVMAEVNKAAPQPVRQMDWRRVALGTMALSAALALFITLKPEPPPRQDARPAQPAVAVVLESTAQWGAQQKQRPVKGDALSPSRLHLGGGHLTLMFMSGVLLQMEGPADIELLTVDHVICHQGKTRAQVPKGAEGFRIETPHGTVTDLGTQMGVNVAEDGKTRMAVFEGSAEATLQQPGQDAVRTLVVKATQAIEMLSNTGEILTSDSENFLPALTPQIEPLQLAADYAQAVHSAKPRHYWRLDHQLDNSIPNEVSGSPPTLLLVGGAKLTADAAGHVSGQFGGASSKSGLTAVEPWLMQRSGSAVELWFASTSSDQVTLAGFSSALDNAKHVCLLEYSSVLLNNSRIGRVTGPRRVRYLMRWPGDSKSGVNLLSAPDITLYQWHHLVAQQKERQMELYLDGRLIGRGMADEMPQEFAAAMTFGYAIIDGPAPTRLPTAPSRHLSGRIAEIAIYDHMLTVEQIREHAKLGGKKL